MIISVVTSLYYSEKYIQEFYTRISESILKIGHDYELVFVNDASPDNSRDRVLEIIEKDEKVKLVDLSKNFGQYPAMFAGMRESSGELIYICDSDLEEPPELIMDFYKKLSSDSAIDVVFGIVKERQGGFVRKTLGGLFFSVLESISDHKIPRNQAWARLMRRNYMVNLLEFDETETFPAGLMHITGFNQVSFPIHKEYKGSTTYSPIKRLKFAVIAITSFSSKPLIYITFLGFVIFIISLAFILYILSQKIFFTNFQAGWSSLIASIWCIGGLIIFCLGIIGFYIAKIFNQVKKRPLYIVKKVYQKDGALHNKKG